MPRTDIPDVPDVSAGWYLDVVAAAARLPGWVQLAFEFATDGVVVGFALALVLLAVRARHRPGIAMATALVGPVCVLLAYVISEAIKGVFRVDRPCRTLDVATIAPTIAHCPELGDWSFPSNHATIAGAAAVAIWWSSSRWGSVAAAAALLAAASRVIVGVHYPHDVLVGLTIGAVTASALVPLLAPMASPLVQRLRGAPGGGVLGRGPATGVDAPTVRLPRHR
ncbi:phosphatase PAP2 family protein [Pseudonocardia sp. TRM90224]|uniref:phosphatase PAP2 family protein n=1 Tax=Pseudonocardia sp. TRM90224 TaxID=2812678 RepID=UPI001E3E194B|nr:phosphatase PAP2 family protein [Pseudonocardia sp. TRM90224]